MKGITVVRLASTWVLLALSSVSGADAVTMSLCTARPGGVYQRAGELVAKYAPAAALRVQVVETAGSMQNLERMARGECDAAMVQVDVLLAYRIRGSSGRLRIAPPIHLYDEMVHLICRRRSGVRSLTDLRRRASEHLVLIGEAGSGSEATWQAMVFLDKSYGAVATRALGGDAALAALTSAPARASCMLVVIGLNSPLLLRADAHGDVLRLVPVDLFEFRDAEMVDNRIYHSRRIPVDAYRQLTSAIAGQPGEPGGIETLAVGATIVTRRDWARKNKAAHRAFRAAVDKATPEIRAAVGEN